MVIKGENEMDTIDGWITSIVRWFEIIPVQVWAVMGGLFIGFAITQWIKRNFTIGVMFPSLTEVKQKLAIRLLALSTTAIPTYFIWPDNGETVNALWAAIAVGFGSPIIYKVISFMVYKKWPALQERFTGMT